MKKEIEEIFDDVLQQDWDYFEQKTITMTYQSRIADKILSLIEKDIGECEDRIRAKIQVFLYEPNKQDEYGIAQDIINIIIKRIKE